MTNIVNETILKYLNKPVTLIEDLYRIEISAISNSGNNVQLQTQEIFRLLINNQKIEEFLRDIHWTDVYERIAIRYSNEPSIEMKMEEFNEKIWNKCVGRVSSNPKILGYKKNTKSIRKEARDILEEITKD